MQLIRLLLDGREMMMGKLSRLKINNIPSLLPKDETFIRPFPCSSSESAISIRVTSFPSTINEVTVEGIIGLGSESPQPTISNIKTSNPTIVLFSIVKINAEGRIRTVGGHKDHTRLAI